jgi:hypothetical protein
VTDEPVLSQWTIYDHPSDYPTGWVVRRFAIHPSIAIPREATYHRTLEQARAAVPEGAVCIGRAESDDPVIVEVWT